MIASDASRENADTNRKPASRKTIDQFIVMLGDEAVEVEVQVPARCS